MYNRKKHKFIPIDSLTSHQECDTLSLKGMIVWKKKLLNLTERYTKEIPNQNTILNIAPRTKVELADHNYTEQYGNTTMGKYRKGIKYIIKTIILIIMTFLTWSVYQVGNIYQNTLKKIGKKKNIEKKCQNICLTMKRGKISVENGTKVKKKENGIGNTQNALFSKINLKKKEFVNFVKKNILHIKINKNIVQQNVNKKEQIYQNLKYAKYVDQHSTQHLINQELAQENAKIVYNLKVKDAGCYYANNILVSNCDSEALFSSEIIEENSQPQVAEVLVGIREYM